MGKITLYWTPTEAQGHEQQCCQDYPRIASDLGVQPPVLERCRLLEASAANSTALHSDERGTIVTDDVVAVLDIAFQPELPVADDWDDGRGIDCCIGCSLLLNVLRDVKGIVNGEWAIRRRRTIQEAHAAASLKPSAIITMWTTRIFCKENRIRQQIVRIALFGMMSYVSWFIQLLPWASEATSSGNQVIFL